MATGITVFEALQCADDLAAEGINVRVLDCYAICPIDADGLLNSLKATKYPMIITVEDHYAHGGLGDFVAAAISTQKAVIKKIAVTKISGSGTKEQLMDAAGITASHISKKVHQLLRIEKPVN